MSEAQVPDCVDVHNLAQEQQIKHPLMVTPVQNRCMFDSFNIYIMYIEREREILTRGKGWGISRTPFSGLRISLNTSS